MKHSAKSSENYTAIIGIVLSVLSILLFVWFIRSLPPPSQSSSPTSEDAARYEEYKSEQLQNENGKQEACMDRMARDVERYGEQVISTYDCAQ